MFHVVPLALGCGSSSHLQFHKCEGQMGVGSLDQEVVSLKATGMCPHKTPPTTPLVLWVSVALFPLLIWVE